jgi:hypothetical protein
MKAIFGICAAYTETEMLKYWRMVSSGMLRRRNLVPPSSGWQESVKKER